MTTNPMLGFHSVAWGFFTVCAYIVGVLLCVVVNPVVAGMHYDSNGLGTVVL